MISISNSRIIISIPCDYVSVLEKMCDDVQLTKSQFISIVVGSLGRQFDNGVSAKDILNSLSYSEYQKPNIRNYRNIG